MLGDENEEKDEVGVEECVWVQEHNDAARFNDFYTHQLNIISRSDYSSSEYYCLRTNIIGHCVGEEGR